MFEFLEDAFYGWTTMGFIIWVVISLASIYVSWFVKIPSAFGATRGIPFTTKIGMSVFIPIITFFLIKYKDWTAETFRKKRKN